MNCGASIPTRETMNYINFDASMSFQTEATVGNQDFFCGGLRLPISFTICFCCSLLLSFC